VAPEPVKVTEDPEQIDPVDVWAVTAGFVFTVIVTVDDSA